MNGPGPDKVSTSPVAFSSLLSTVKLPAETATSTMLPTATSPVLVVVASAVVVVGAVSSLLHATVVNSNATAMTPRLPLRSIDSFLNLPWVC
ncbi:unannotated protein [freshwater metagenome]|uniref:Unannotated protein n=1 Tax=freshwater metagenome TaxID=449393 RepID=A0A6J7SF34_9ZZZZ